jgi:endonuclease-3
MKLLSSPLSSVEIEELFTILSSLNPHPTTELKYLNSFTLLIAVVLSAQSTDQGVNKATCTLFEIADTPEKMLLLGEENLQQYIKSIGFYRTKARNIIALSKILVEEYKSQVPHRFEDLIRLPGVGRKTANVILNTVFNQPTLAVDTHVFRVSNRTGLAIGKTPADVEERLLKNVPKRFLLHAHHWLILHGRYICKALKPQCSVCPIQHLCHYPAKRL